VAAKGRHSEQDSALVRSWDWSQLLDYAPPRRKVGFGRRGPEVRFEEAEAIPLNFSTPPAASPRTPYLAHVSIGDYTSKWTADADALILPY